MESSNQYMEGYLFKKSPKMFVGYQKRFFCIRDEGRKLIYYKKSPTPQDKPKGVLEILEILDLQKRTDTELIFWYAERKFELKAENAADAGKWFETLRGLIDSKMKKESSVTVSSGSDREKKEKWRAKNIDHNTLDKIQKENEEVSGSQQLIEEDNQYLLELKGIKAFLGKYKPETLETRICMGFLKKKGEKKISTYKKRWFILISAKPLHPEVHDDHTLEEALLPPWMKFDTLYYFKYSSKNDSSPFCGSINLRDCQSVVIEEDSHKNLLKEMGKNIANFSSKFFKMGRLIGLDSQSDFVKPEHGYGFKYNDSANKLHKRWIIALEQAKNNYLLANPNHLLEGSVELKNAEKLLPERTQSLNPNLNNSPLRPKEKIDRFEEKSEKYLEDKEDSLKFFSPHDSNFTFSPQNYCKEGYVQRLSSNKILGWKSIYLILDRNNIGWKKKNSDKLPKISFPVTSIVGIRAEGHFQWIIEMNKKSYSFKVDDQKERNAWVRCLNNCKAGLSKSINNTEFSDYDLSLTKKSQASDGLKPQLLDKNQSRHKSNPDPYEQSSLINKFYILNEKPDGSKHVTSESKVEEEQFKVPTKKKTFWGQLFCCYIDQNTYE